MHPNRVLITGATGFVGCRVAEVLSAKKVQVVGMVRSWHKAARLARVPVKLVHADLNDQESLTQAMRGCDTVIHCALDSNLEGTAHHRAMVSGTRNLMGAACKEGVKKVVYLSSTAVYGFWPATGPVNEETPTRYTGNGYADGKIDSEKAALRYYRERGLPVTVLRPSLVYGPFETFWAAHLIRCLSRNWMTLINGGNGICNSLYIDNLVSAIWRAAQTETAAGQVFVISDGEKVTWRQMIEGHAVAMKDCRLPLPDATAEKMARGVLERFPNGVRGAVLRPGVGQSYMKTNGAVAPAPTPVAPTPVIPLSDHDTRLYTCNVAFSIDKARKVLGYQPEIGFPEGIRRTGEWIKWMKL